MPDPFSTPSPNSAAASRDQAELREARFAMRLSGDTLLSIHLSPCGLRQDFT
jgi:hypothetical protein